MDEADSADNVIEMNLAAALARTRVASGLPVATGFCFSCDNIVGRGMRWCDADCRDDDLSRKAALADPRNIKPTLN